MVTKKDLIIAVLSTFCLVSTLFMIVPTRSSPSTSLPGYNPWCDLNDDGKIDILDVVLVTNKYATTGTPINKTALLYEMNATFTQLLAKINSLNASLTVLQAETAYLEALVAEQQSRISALESEIVVLNATKLGEPNWDSGWLSIPAGEYRVLTHNLHTTNVIVYMVGYDFNGEEFHQIDYGGEKTYDLGGSKSYGARWEELTTTTIKVTRFADDYNWDLIRVLIWKIP